MFALLRFLVQSWVWFCARLHHQIPGECRGQSAAVCLQGSGLHPGTRVTQVPLQWGAGQVSRARIKVCICECVCTCVCVWVRVGGKQPCVGESKCVFCSDSCVWLLWAQCSHSACSPASLWLGQFARVLFWPPHQRSEPTLPHKDIREVSSLVPGGQAPAPAPSRCTPLASLGVVTVGLFRMLTPDALWAGSALTKVKTPPYASPSPLKSHTLLLYPRVRELMGFFLVRRESWFPCPLVGNVTSVMPVKPVRKWKTRKMSHTVNHLAWGNKISVLYFVLCEWER